jgi:AcrR family transcriptional regulator
VTKRSAQTRARLLEAAFPVFAAKAFGQIRIEEVCTAAGYTRAAFYSQFASLEELNFALYLRDPTLGDSRPAREDGRAVHRAKAHRRPDIKVKGREVCVMQIAATALDAQP